MKVVLCILTEYEYIDIDDNTKQLRLFTCFCQRRRNGPTEEKINVMSFHGIRMTRNFKILPHPCDGKI